MGNSLLKTTLLAGALSACFYSSSAQQCEIKNLVVNPGQATSATANWDVSPPATQYEYVVSLTPPPFSVGTITSATTIMMSGLAPGKTYYVCVRAICTGGAMSDWTCGELKMPDAASVNTVTANGDFAITAYPNPTTNTVTLALPERYAARGKLMVTNIMGAAVYSKNVDGRYTNIEMGHLAPGIYLVKYADAENSYTVKISKL